MRIEYLIVTKQEEGFCDSKEAFIKLLEANSQIKIDKDKLEFNDGSCFLEIDFLVETDQIKDEKQRYFHLKLHCKDDGKIVELTKITRIIKAISTKLNINNSEISTLWDDMSIYYATQSYPLINEIENLMRNLILKFMIVNVGMDWSNKVAHNKTIEKKDFDEIKNLTSIIKPKL